MPMADPRLLTLTQCLSPAFPTGAFAYSHGVETAVRAGWIDDAGGLRDWLADCLLHGSGRTDAIWLRLSRATADPLPLNASARSYAISHERLREGDRQGAAFVRTANAVWSLDLPGLLMPVAVGQVARRLDLDPDTTVALYLQSFVANLVAAALRLCPIGQTAGQQVIHALQPACEEITSDTRDATEDDLFSNAFLSDIAAIRHETLQPRLFQS